MKIVPLTIKDANAFVRQHHRHSAPTAGGKYAIGLQHEGRIVGVAIAGRPVARLLAADGSAELLRCCVAPDAPKGAASKLNARAKRIWQLMGGTKWHTYSLADESGASIRGTFGETCGQPAATVRADRWSRQSRPRKKRDIETADKLRWDWDLSEIPA